MDYAWWGLLTLFSLLSLYAGWMFLTIVLEKPREKHHQEEE